MPMSDYHQFFFDVDSTLVRVETLDELVTDAEVRRQVEELTRASMNGELPFIEVFPRKLALLAPTRARLAELGRRAGDEWLVDGAEDLVAAIHAAGKEAWILTANFRDVAGPLAARLGIPPERVLANDIRFDAAGAFAGCADSPLLGSGGKPEAMRPHVRARDAAVMVGDSTSDLACRSEVGLFVGFGGVSVRPAVRDAADVFVTEPSLRSLLAYV